MEGVMRGRGPAGGGGAGGLSYLKVRQYSPYDATTSQRNRETHAGAHHASRPWILGIENTVERRGDGRFHGSGEKGRGPGDIDRQDRAASTGCPRLLRRPSRPGVPPAIERNI